MILCIPPNTLSSQQKSALSKKGNIIIETNEPDKIRVINPETSVETNDLFMAALFSLKSSTPINQQEKFINELYRRLKEGEEYSEQNLNSKP